MTESSLAPYWADDDEWTGFLLQVVPATELPVPATELYWQVRSRIEADAVLYDLVTVALTPLPADSGASDKEILSTLISSIMAPGHFFAPRGVFALVVVGAREPDVNQTLRRLAEWPLLRRLRVMLFPHVVEVDPGTDGLSPATVVTIADIAKTVIADYEREPDIAVDEATFLVELTKLIQQDDLAGSEPEREFVPTTEAPAQPTAPAADTPADIAVPAVAGPPAATAAPPAPLTAPTDPLRTPLTASRSLRKPVVHASADIVLTQRRPPLRRLVQPELADIHVMAQLAIPNSAAALAYLVFVPDDELQPRDVTKRRRTAALDLDRVLASVVADAGTGRPLTVAVEVLTATSPLRKHGPIVTAGNLTGGILPKVPIELFDLFDTVDALLDVMRRSTRSLAARDVEVLSHHLIFLAAGGLRDTNATGTEWDRLLRHARITWVHFGRGEPSCSELERESPFGVHILTDKDDIVALIKRESEALYRWPAPVAAPQAAADSGEEIGSPAKKAHRWWPGRRLTPSPRRITE